jgi:hypothetical protein
MSLVAAAKMPVFSIYKEVNRRLPKDAQFNVTGFGARQKLFEVLRLYAELYPESPKRWQTWILALFGFALLFGGFVASWFLPH